MMLHNCRVYLENMSAVCEFGSKVRTFGCAVMGSVVLFSLSSRLLLYSAGSGVNRVQVVLSEFSVRLLCFVQALTLCMCGCMYFLTVLVLVCVCDGDVICVGHDLNRCSGSW